jgi:hypothetical protein
VLPVGAKGLAAPLDVRPGVLRCVSTKVLRTSNAGGASNGYSIGLQSFFSASRDPLVPGIGIFIGSREPFVPQIRRDSSQFLWSVEQSRSIVDKIFQRLH